MSLIVGETDSMNFSNYGFESLFDSNDYIIITVKGLGFFDSQLWLETFGKKLTKNIVEAKIVFTNTGLAIPLKRFARNPKMQTIEFAGLKGYDEKSELKLQLLKDLLSDGLLNSSFITRWDIAMDFKGKIPNKVIKQICKYRSPSKRWKWNTTYYKTAKEKKTNANIDIKRYYKSIKENLSYPLERLEFVFKGGYVSKLRVQDIERSFYKKMEKTICNFTTLKPKIRPIFSL